MHGEPRLVSFDSSILKKLLIGNKSFISFQKMEIVKTFPRVIEKFRNSKQFLSCDDFKISTPNPEISGERHGLEIRLPLVASLSCSLNGHTYLAKQHNGNVWQRQARFGSLDRPHERTCAHGNTCISSTFNSFFSSFNSFFFFFFSSSFLLLSILFF